MAETEYCEYEEESHQNEHNDHNHEHEDENTEDTDTIINNIAWGSPKLKISVEMVGSLPSTKSGKKNYLISKMPTYDWVD